MNVVRLRHRFFTHSLILDRTPKFLRFTQTGVPPDIRWNALDKLEDTPIPEEQLLAARLAQVAPVHIDGVDRSGIRFGQWHTSVEYEPVEPQPAEDTMRDTAKWQAWCYQQLETESPVQ